MVSSPLEVRARHFYIVYEKAFVFVSQYFVSTGFLRGLLPLVNFLHRRGEPIACSRALVARPF
jgi:hypothetical protein